MKKIIASLLALLLLFAMVGCGDKAEPAAEAPAEEESTNSSVVTGRAGIDHIGADGIDWNHMSMDELYKKALEEGGTITIYATTTDADTARKHMRKQYPDLQYEFISCDTDTIMPKIEMEANSGNPMADVVVVKDSSGEVFNEFVLYNILELYFPEEVCKHISDEMLQYGLPLYSTFNPWFYNTRMYDKVPITSWWDIVEGYNPDTASYIDANGNNTQYWTVYSKDITAPSYAALWAQLISDGPALEAQYTEQYGKPLDYTYASHLKNTPGLMELPENNAGVELFWRFSQMTIVPLADGDAVVEAVHDSVNGPTLGLCSASKLDNSKQAMGEGGMDIAWVTGLSPYTAQDTAAYAYVVSGCDNPAGARLFIMFMMGGADGKSGCYTVFDKLGHWSVRDDVTYQKAGITYEEANLKAPDYSGIYQNYPNVKAYWTLWSSTR